MFLILFIPPLEDLTETVADVLPQEEFDIQEVDLQLFAQPNTKRMTWDQVLVLILAIITTFYPILNDHLQSEIEQKHHDEIVQKLDGLINVMELHLSSDQHDVESRPLIDPDTK